MGETGQDAISAAKDAAEELGDSKSLKWSARAGLIAYGTIHILVGWLALMMAWGEAAESPDLSGALLVVAKQPLGRVMLWIVAGGLLGLAIWQASEAIRGPKGEQRDRRRRLASAAKALVYAALAVSAARVGSGSGSADSMQPEQATSGLLTHPAGRVLMIVAGLIVIGVGVSHVVKGVKKSFLTEIATSSMSPEASRGLARLGQIGYIAKGVVVGAVGAPLTYTAVTFDRERQGIDGALYTILMQPFGRYLVTLLALGFAVFGVFAILQSRYRRM